MSFSGSFSPNDFSGYVHPGAYSFSYGSFSELFSSEGDEPTPPSPSQPAVSGAFGYGYRGGARQRSAAEVRHERERYGIEVSEVISAVAVRQAERLQQDAHQRLEELARELELRRIEWRAEYLEELNVRRERLIDAEIAARMKLLQIEKQEEEALVMILSMMA